MVQLTRIYTRGGDKGKSSLGDGTRLYKNDLRFEAIGQVDEANSSVGLVRLYTQDHSKAIDDLLYRIQNDLFDVGADLCTPVLTQPALRISAHQVDFLEKSIDAYNTELPALSSFVLPGGTSLSSFLHQARTIVRRAERSVIALHLHSPLNLELIKYMNRLSDLLFVLARYSNNKDKGDILWVPGQNRDYTETK
jgi:cob(I)alamin adenosyltransferase